MEQLCTVIQFVYPHELGVPRSLLESEGIECFVRDENFVSLQPFYSNLIGGIRLQVRERDARRALQILHEGGFIDENDGKTKSETKTETRTSDGSSCPYCGSVEIVRKKDFTGKIPAFASVFATFLIGISATQPIAFFRKIYHCMDCGKNFKKTSSPSKTA